MNRPVIPDGSQPKDKRRAEMSVYIQIKDCDRGPTLTVTPDSAKEIIDSMVQNKNETDENESYTFSTVEMTPQEFDSLPEFTGF